MKKLILLILSSCCNFFPPKTHPQHILNCIVHKPSSVYLLRPTLPQSNTHIVAARLLRSTTAGK